MNITNFKKSGLIIFAVFASFGLSIALQGVFAWTAPSATPPSGNVKPPVYNEHATDPANNVLINKSTAINGNLTLTGTGYINGKLGIGVTSPTSQLHIDTTALNDYVYIGGVGNTSFSGSRLVSDTGEAWIFRAGSAYAALKSLGGWALDKSLNIYNGSAGPVAIQTSGANRLVVDAVGNVGIGTDAPTVPLQVNGLIKSAAAVGDIAAAGDNVVTVDYLEDYVDAAGGGSSAVAIPSWCPNYLAIKVSTSARYPNFGSAAAFDSACATAYGTGWGMCNPTTISNYAAQGCIPSRMDYDYGYQGLATDYSNVYYNNATALTYMAWAGGNGCNNWTSTSASYSASTLWYAYTSTSGGYYYGSGGVLLWPVSALNQYAVSFWSTACNQSRKFLCCKTFTQ